MDKEKRREEQNNHNRNHKRTNKQTNKQTNTTTDADGHTAVARAPRWLFGRDLLWRCGGVCDAAAGVGGAVGTAAAVSGLWTHPQQLRTTPLLLRMHPIR